MHHSIQKYCHIKLSCVSMAINLLKNSVTESMFRFWYLPSCTYVRNTILNRLNLYSMWSPLFISILNLSFTLKGNKERDVAPW